MFWSMKAVEDRVKREADEDEGGPPPLRRVSADSPAVVTHAVETPVAANNTAPRAASGPRIEATEFMPASAEQIHVAASVQYHAPYGTKLANTKTPTTASPAKGGSPLTKQDPALTTPSNIKSLSTSPITGTPKSTSTPLKEVPVIFSLADLESEMSQPPPAAAEEAITPVVAEPATPPQEGPADFEEEEAAAHSAESMPVESVEETPEKVPQQTTSPPSPEEELFTSKAVASFDAAMTEASQKKQDADEAEAKAAEPAALIEYEPFVDQLATKLGPQRLSPVAAFLRALTIRDSEYWSALDMWLSSPSEASNSSLLSNYGFITSVHFTAPITAPETAPATIPYDVSNPNSFLGGIGKDMENALYANPDDRDDLEAIHKIGEVIGGAVQKASRREAFVMQSDEQDRIDLQNDGNNFLCCYIHERVARTLRKERVPTREVYELIGRRIVEGAILRGEWQYKKKVDHDVRELRLDEKERVLYAREGRAILILAIIRDHKLSTPIARAQREMDVMKAWMKANANNETTEEPFVIIDSSSGRLRPLYRINITYGDDGRVKFEDVGVLHNNSVFNPSIFDLVLSPQQERVHSQIIESGAIGSLANPFFDKEAAKVKGKPEEAPALGEDEEVDADKVDRRGTRPGIKMVFIQGSAGNGKTTCLLTSGLARAKDGENVVLVCATSHLAKSIREDLNSADAKVIHHSLIKTQAEIKQEIRDWLQKPNPELELTKQEVSKWLDSLSSYSSKKKEGFEVEGLVDWLINGSKESSNSEAYRDYSIRYADWKRINNRYDAGDIWKEALMRLKKADFTRNEHCDILIVDEAQLYPADSLFELFLMWYHPCRCILVGMDTKQAIKLGCSKRSELLEAARRASKYIGWSAVEESRNNLTTNFRLPAKMIALSNSLVRTLKDALPKVFDEYSLDAGFESRIVAEADASALDVEMDTIMAFPCLLISGNAGIKLRNLIRQKMDQSRGTLTTLRFANTDYEPDDILAGLPTIHFESCSGLESALPVIVDCLLNKWITPACPRTIFSKAFGERKKDLTEMETSTLSTALCRIYTVMTRCRGPLIWIEDGNVDGHPLIKLLKKKLSEYKTGITFITEEETYDENRRVRYKIDAAFVDKIFSPVGGDLEELNMAWEDSIRNLLNLMRRDLHTCISEYQEGLKKSPHVSVSAASLAQLRASIQPLCSAFKRIDNNAALKLSSIIESLETLFKLHTGDWAAGTEDRETMLRLLEIANMFPYLTETVAACSTTSISRELPKFHDTLVNKTLKLCMCNSYPRTRDELTAITAITIPRIPGLASGSGGTSKDDVWVISRVDAVNLRRNKCISQGAFVLCNLSNHAQNDSAIIFRFEHDSNLVIFKGANHWLEFSEVSLDDVTQELVYTASNNAGMKCRCSHASYPSIAHFAAQNCYGQVVTAKGALASDTLRGCLRKFNKDDELSSCSEMLIAPDVGNVEMINRMVTLLGFSLGEDAARSAASFIWNNLFGGRVYLIAIEAKLQPWGLLGSGLDIELMKRRVDQEIAKNHPDALVSPALETSGHRQQKKKKGPLTLEDIM